MNPFSFLGNTYPLRMLRGIRSIQGIQSREQLYKIIVRERARADRSGECFSLVVFRLKGRKRDTYQALLHLSRQLVTRARITDEVGWFDKTSLGAILVGADSEGARKFFSIVIASMPQSLTAPTLELYVYPTPSPGGSEVEPGVDGEWNEVANATPAVQEVEPGKPLWMGTASGSPNVLSPVFVQQIPLWKDISDMGISVTALFLLSPLFLLISAYIKIVSPGPVFYRQERVGFRGKMFKIWKFRTMKVNSEAKGHEEYLKFLIQKGDQAMEKLDAKKDPRIIPLGNILRQTGLDELPQLINVVLGDMSLVGPRPCLPYEACEYDFWQSERFNTIPGLTGLWQVSGKNRTTFKEMMRFDIRYGHKLSFWMEIQILFKTFPAIVQQVRDHRAKASGKPDEGKPVSGKENA